MFDIINRGIGFIFSLTKLHEYVAVYKSESGMIYDHSRTNPHLSIFK